MHAVAAFFASIITFVSGFFAPTVASNSPVNVQTTQPAAAAAAQAEIAGNPFNDPAAASAVVAATAVAPAPAVLPPPAQTVINQPVIERIIERIVPQGTANISTETLTAILSDFEQSISSRIAALNPPKAAIPEQVAAAGNATGAFYPASQRIDQITNTAINTPTITGGSISGASVSGYLPLSGGTLTGALSGTDLNLSGVLTAGALNVGGLSSSGALFAPYFSATSTTATSTFAGGLTAANGSFSILQNANVGIGTAAPSIAGVNSNSRVLSIVGDGTLVNARGVLELANPRASGSLATNDTAGSAFFVMSNNSGNPYIAGILGSLSGSGGANGFGGKLQFQTKTDNDASSATTKMVLDQNGNVGIGTTTPWGKLSITGSGTGTGLAFAVADSANTPRFVIQDNGNVGVGTTSPTAKLQIDDASYNYQLIVNNSIASGNSVMAFALNAANKAAIGVAGAANGLLTGSASGDLIFRSNTGTNSILFSANASTPHMTITSTGNVGIGTTTPATKLDVRGSGDVLTIGGESAATHKFGFDGVGNPYIDGINTNKLLFRTAGSDRVAIDASGNVGIGTTSPDTKLRVSGGYIGTDNLYGLRSRNAANTAWADLINLQADDSLNLYDSKVKITSTGNVGIGVMSPGQKLEVSGNTKTTGYIQVDTVDTGTQGLLFGSAGDTNLYRSAGNTLKTDDSLLVGGNVGIGTTSPTQKLSVAVSGDVLANFDTTNSTGGYVSFSTSGTNRGYIGTGGSLSTGAALSDFVLRSNSDLIFDISGTPRMKILAATGNVGIGTTTPTAQLSTTGTVRFAGLGSAGANLVTDALGNVTASSDERLKDKQGDFTRSLVAINAISPVLYKWRPETGFDTQSTYAGFFAQNVQAAIPEAVSQDSRGHLTLADRPILAALVNATKEIGTITGAFKDSLIAWLGSASNGIGDLFAKDIYATNGTFDTTTANTTNTRELCITDGVNDNAPLCLTKSQLAALLSQTGAAGLPASVISGTATDAPESVLPQAPVIELNGNASSNIEVGDTYNDLGARIIAPEADLNLGIVTMLDGATTTQVSIDTSMSGEHTILYTVTSSTSGLTGRATRTIIVSPAEQPAEPPANDNPFNLVPANDNATSTPVTSWM